MRLVVPMDSPVVVRRNFILDLMKTQSVLTAGKYTDADYEAAKQEPVILASQATAQWRAPQFVWQVRDELGQILCGDTQCEKIDTGGYQVDHDARLPDAADRREVGLRGRDHPQRQEPGRAPQGPRHPDAASGPGSRP